METNVRRYLFILDLAVIGLCAFFLACASAGALAASLPDPPPHAGERRTPSPPPPARPRGPGDILHRNVFCSSCPPLLASAEAQPSVEESPLAEKSALPLSLLAVLYDRPRQPSW